MHLKISFILNFVLVNLIICICRENRQLCLSTNDTHSTFISFSNFLSLFLFFFSHSGVISLGKVIMHIHTLTGSCISHGSNEPQNCLLSSLPFETLRHCIISLNIQQYTLARQKYILTQSCHISYPTATVLKFRMPSSYLIYIPLIVSQMFCESYFLLSHPSIPSSFLYHFLSFL